MNTQKTSSLGVMTRREALRRGLLGTASLALIDRFGLQTRAAPSGPKAKSVIQIWMWGGPSHLDTFDPKPDAGYDYCGPFDKPCRCWHSRPTSMPSSAA